MIYVLVSCSWSTFMFMVIVSGPHPCSWYTSLFLVLIYTLLLLHYLSEFMLHVNIRPNSGQCLIHCYVSNMQNKTNSYILIQIIISDFQLIKPKSGTYSFHNLHWQLGIFHCLILVLNIGRVLDSLISCGNCCHNCGSL